MKNKLFTLTLLCLLVGSFTPPPGVFKKAQMQYPRVKAAYREKLSRVKQYFASQQLQLGRSPVLLRAFKEEGQLEVWAASNAGRYKLVHTYAICAASGGPGPKWRQGDGQVPEGFYEIDKYNPNSNFHLSLGINYPNAADRKRCTARDPGGDIFIHGDCVTIGCLPLTDDKIRELYVMAVETKEGGHKMPVHIFPARLSGDNWQRLRQKHQADQPLIRFWQDLKTGYDWFEKYRRLPGV